MMRAERPVVSSKSSERLLTEEEVVPDPTLDSKTLLVALSRNVDGDVDRRERCELSTKEVLDQGREHVRGGCRRVPVVGKEREEGERREAVSVDVQCKSSVSCPPRPCSISDKHKEE